MISMNTPSVNTPAPARSMTTPSGPASNTPVPSRNLSNTTHKSACAPSLHAALAAAPDLSYPPRESDNTVSHPVNVDANVPLTRELLDALLAAGCLVTIPSAAIAVLQSQCDAPLDSCSLTLAITVTRVPSTLPPPPPCVEASPAIPPAVVSTDSANLSSPIPRTAAAAAAVTTASTATHCPTIDNGDIDTDVSSDSFDAMGIPSALLIGIAAAGFERPTACQRVTIPATLQGRDVLLQAPAGTGKTAAFAVGGLAKLLSAPSGSVLLVLSPNKDLACQTHSMLHRLAKAMPDRRQIGTHVSYGGKSRDSADLAHALRRSSRVAVSATPGRALQHFDRGILNPDSVCVLVVDEFDTMLDRFHDEVRSVTRVLPADCQIIMVSATANDDAVDVARRILRDPVEHAGHNGVSKSVDQYVVDCGLDADDSDDVKRSALVDLVQMSRSRGRAIVFANSIELVDSLTSDLAAAGITKVAAAHGKLPLDQRDAAVAQFRAGDVEVLVATDSVARGLDVQQVATVFHFGVARDHATYVHRSSRCGRQGRRGIAVSIVAGNNERRWLRQIEANEGIAIAPLPADAWRT